MKIEEAITYAIMSDGHWKTTDPEVSPMKRGNRLPPEGVPISFDFLVTRARSAEPCTKEEGRIRVML